VRTIVYCGALRIGECCALNVSDFDIETGTLRVSKAIRKGRVGSTKTAAGTRRVHVPTALRDELAAHVADRVPDQPLFASPQGHRLEGGNFLRQWFRPAITAAGLPERTRVHDLRHTGISLALAAGVSVADVAKWCGHASPVITMSTYAKAIPGREHVVAEALDAIIARPRLRVVS
jgi:integrase